MVDGSGKSREPLKDRTVDVVVVGAGFGGMYMMYKLRQAGFSIQGIEAGSDVGGTWYWNRYPGARCDVPSLFYCYTWDSELQKDWRWSEKYASQPEILAYARHVADRHDLRASVAFDTRVISTGFDAASNRWRVYTDRGDQIIAKYLIMATGCLSTPRTPDIPGAETFTGDVYHTGAWPHEGVDFTGRKVAVIGTGSSGIQSIPQIAAHADRVTVFQRTANYSIPARNRPLTEKDYDNFWQNYETYIQTVRGPGAGFGGNPSNSLAQTAEARRERYEELWATGGADFLTAWGKLLTDLSLNDEAASFVREKTAEVVKNPKTAAALLPTDYPIGTKRICVDIDYFETYNRPNVELVDLRETAMIRMSPAGVDTTAATYCVDAVVFATGFDAMTGALLAIDIEGVNGLTLAEAWSEGPKAYLGLSIAGFPNMFLITGPGSPSVLSNMINSIEQHAEWIADCITYLREHALDRIEADPAEQEAWVAHVRDVADKTLFPRAASWYMGANIPGKPRVFMPYIGAGYRKTCDEVAAGGYRRFILTKEPKLTPAG